MSGRRIHCLHALCCFAIVLTATLCPAEPPERSAKIHHAVVAQVLEELAAAEGEATFNAKLARNVDLSLDLVGRRCPTEVRDVFATFTVLMLAGAPPARVVEELDQIPDEFVCHENAEEFLAWCPPLSSDMLVHARIAEAIENALLERASVMTDQTRVRQLLSTCHSLCLVQAVPGGSCEAACRAIEYSRKIVLPPEQQVRIQSRLDEFLASCPPCDQNHSAPVEPAVR